MWQCGRNENERVKPRCNETVLWQKVREREINGSWMFEGKEESDLCLKKEIVIVGI